jgi:hypothetical protein
MKETVFYDLKSKPKLDSKYFKLKLVLFNDRGDFRDTLSHRISIPAYAIEQQ